ncbi:MAG: site-specific integrase [Spartobacteria bacterium]|nr:site-specific integrase [Spartobacteria bacterium]
MPKIHLRPQFVVNPPKPKDKAKVDYFDSALPGFLLEVRKTGTATYYLRYRDKNGKIRQIRIGTPETISVENARSTAQALKSQAVIGFDPRAEQNKLKVMPTFKDFASNQYLAYVKTYKRSWELDQKIIEQRLLRLWGHRQMHSFVPSDLLAIQNSLISGGLKAGTVNRYMALVKHIFNMAEKWEVIDKAPTRATGNVYDPAHKERFLTEEEMHRLLTALSQSDRPVIPEIIEFLLLTGARKKEVTHLPWSEINLDKALWTLPMERNKAKKVKVVPLSTGALAVLERQRGKHPVYVFPNPDTGKPILQLHWTWDKIRKEAGLADVRIHDLRHSFASFLVNSGRSLYEVQKLLGHAQISTTQRYAHLSDETLLDAAETLGHVVGKWKVENETEPAGM